MARLKLEILKWIAEARNAELRALVASAETILHDEDLAADFIYGVIDLNKAIAEAEK